MADRFWAKVDKNGPGGCWLWQGSKGQQGYGRLNVEGKFCSAHRLAYESLVGPVPDGLQLDHLCRVRHCVNPSHLEPVTNRENALRGVSFSAANARKTHCEKGHPLDGDNLRPLELKRGRRRCWTCYRKQKNLDKLRKRRRRQIA